MREGQGTVFGEVAELYDDVRPDYPAELFDAVLAYAGGAPARIVEVGAGIGKATAALARLGAPMTCVEPDAQMAAVLRARFAAAPQVSVAGVRFEDWAAQAVGVPLLVCAQAWHWLDAARRCPLVHDALAPGGALAVFGHKYNFADAGLEEALDAAYAEYAPQLRAADRRPGAAARAPREHPHYAELAASGLLTDLDGLAFTRIVPYPTARYPALCATFSPHRMLSPDRRAGLHGAIAAAVDARGGVVEVRRDTVLVLARRAG
jgi:SAM-dependent methyltransferase